MPTHRRLSELQITKDLARSLRGRLVGACIRDLQAMQNELLLGEDSGLRDTWDEICVQQRLGESFAWRAYLETIDVFIESRLEGLRPYELDALWLATPEGDDWDNELDDERADYPVFLPDVAAHLQGEVLNQANDWNNKRITRYLEGRYG